MKKFLSRFLSMVICLVFLGTSTVGALSAKQKQIFDGGTLYLDDECAVASSSSDDTKDIASSIYVLGDSLTVGMRDQGGLQAKLEDKGWTVSEIEATGGDTIARALPKVEIDKEKIASSGTVVVSLGTNPEDNFPAKVERLINKIEEHNSSADIKWINVVDPVFDVPSTEVNNTISNKSRQLNFEVIDWKSEISARPGRYPTVDTLHQTPEGYRNRSQWTANQIGQAPESDAVGDDAGGGSDTTGTSADLTTLPLREKLAQLLMPRVDNTSELNTVTEKKVGGIFVGRNSITSLSSAIEEKQGGQHKYIVSIDGEGGTVGVPIGTNPPSAREMGNMSEEEVKNIAKDFGKELADLGVTMNLAPVADVVDDVSSGVIKTRSFGATNQKVNTKAGVFADGLREAGLLPTFKHFPGHGHATTTIGGSTLADTHLNPNAYVENLSELSRNDLGPFVTLGNSGSSAIMVGHLIIPDVDRDNPATVSPAVIGGVLRDELGYDGLVITDDMGDMAPITSRFSNFPEAVFRAIKAGNDMVLFVGKNNQIDAILNRLERAVESGALTEERIDESLARIASARNFGVGAEDVLEGCACGASSSGGPSDFSGNNNVEIAFNYFISKGLSATQAAAIVGNFMQESGPELNPEANSGSHYGIAQWDIGGREANLRTFARETNRANKFNTLEVQLEFVWLETTGEGATPSVPGNNRPVLPAMDAADGDLPQLVKIWLVEWEGAKGQEEEQRLEYAQQVLDTYGGGSGGGGQSAECAGYSGLDGVQCPANLEAHPSQPGYFRMPDAPNGEYTKYSIPERQYGSRELVCVLYSVALAYYEQMDARSHMDIGDLNASGHKSHYKGIAADLDGQGEIVAADNENYDSPPYSTEATITLGKLFVDTGQMKNLWWCGDGDGSLEAIVAYANSQGKPFEGAQCLTGHYNHFHVDVKEEFALPSFTP